MASFAPSSGLSSLLKEGTKHIAGVDAAVLKNIDACTQLGALVSTSLGPHARRKIVVNRLGKLFVTSDAATILRELEVIHPAAQLLVKAAEAQEREAGDGTAAVVILASALLEQAEQMLRMGLHTSEIITGMGAGGRAGRHGGGGGGGGGASCPGERGTPGDGQAGWRGGSAQDRWRASPSGGWPCSAGFGRRGASTPVRLDPSCRCLVRAAGPCRTTPRQSRCFLLQSFL